MFPECRNHQEVAVWAVLEEERENHIKKRHGAQSSMFANKIKLRGLYADRKPSEIGKICESFSNSLKLDPSVVKNNLFDSGGNLLKQL